MLIYMLFRMSLSTEINKLKVHVHQIYSVQMAKHFLTLYAWAKKMCLWDIGSSQWGSSFSPKIMASVGALIQDPAGTITPGMLKK